MGDTSTVTTVGDLLDERLVTIAGEDTLERAAELMQDEYVGAVLVENAHGRVIGILSERDIVRAVAEGLACDEERVVDAMTSRLAEVEPSVSLDEALALMRRHEIRHLVVREEGSDDTNIVSMRRLFEAYVERQGDG